MKKVVIDLNKTIKNLDGSSTSQTFGQTLGQTFMFDGETKIPRKLSAWGEKLYNEGTIEVDEADLREIIAYVEAPGKLAAFVKAGILKVLDDCQDTLKEDKVEN